MALALTVSTMSTALLRCRFLQTAILQRSWLFAFKVCSLSFPRDDGSLIRIAWRKIIKDLVIFFKEIQKSYEMRSKLLLSASNVINNSFMPPSFLKSGGLADATEILRHFHRQGYLEANKAAEVESEVVNQLMGLRNDLQKKIKEIKNLSSDFKNNVDREVESTRKLVCSLHEALGLVDTDPAATSGRSDPFIVRLNVEKQIKKQIEEENYLHRVCPLFGSECCVQNTNE